LVFAFAIVSFASPVLGVSSAVTFEKVGYYVYFTLVLITLKGEFWDNLSFVSKYIILVVFFHMLPTELHHKPIQRVCYEDINEYNYNTIENNINRQCIKLKIIKTTNDARREKNGLNDTPINVHYSDLNDVTLLA
jgi:hypothetical protein